MESQAFLAAFYVQTTGDWGVLDESVPFLTARALEPGEDEAYLRPEVAADGAHIYSFQCQHGATASRSPRKCLLICASAF